MGSIIRHAAHALYRIFSEKRCSCCASPFTPARETLPHSPSRYFCPACLSNIIPRKAGFCPTCGELAAWSTLPVAPCAKCLQTPPAWQHIFFYAEHYGLLRQMLLSLKFQKRTYLAQALASLLLDAHPHLLENVDMLVPIPLHRNRLKTRGYNQAHELAKAIFRQSALQKNTRSGHNLPSKVALCPRLLTRTVATRPQTGLSKQERHINTRDIFTARAEVAGRRILLIDDIMTTGATLASAAKSLHQAGALQVFIAVIGRTPPHRLSQEGYSLFIKGAVD